MEGSIKKLKIRSNKQQIDVLIKYMVTHPEFEAIALTKHLQENPKVHRDWARLIELLNRLGPKRTLQQWRVCWRDQKYKRKIQIKEEPLAANESGAGNTDPDVDLNSTEQEVEISTEAQSPIGFDIEDTPEELPDPQPEALPRVSQQIPPDIRRDGITHKFLKAQLELNSLVRELVCEVRQSNKLKAAQMRLFRRRTNMQRTSSGVNESNNTISQDEAQDEMTESNQPSASEKKQEISAIEIADLPKSRTHPRESNKKRNGHESELEIAAKGWVLKLSRVATEQGRYAEKIINDTVFEAGMGTLTRYGAHFLSKPPSVPKHIESTNISICDSARQSLDNSKASSDMSEEEFEDPLVFKKESE